MNQASALTIVAEPVPQISSRAERRLARMRLLSRLLDTAILLPGGYRIGLDPIIGLLPGFGDFVGGTLSVWLIYDAARLGISKRTLTRMAINVIFDTAAGSVPVIGDVLDAVWKSNARNMRLVEAEYKPGQGERSFARIGLAMLLILFATYGAFIAAAYYVIKAVLALFH
jgi:hypothetical protein